jgi:ABC-type transporter Mla MlaB component
MANEENARPATGQPRPDVRQHVVRGHRDDVIVLVGPSDRECVLDVVKKRLPSLLDPPPSAVVVDLSGLARLTSGTVAALLWTGATCRKRGVPVRVRHVPARGDEILRRTGLSLALALGEAGQ